MKSILVIGMGRFGKNLAVKLLELGNEVMIVDQKEENIEMLSNKFSDCQIANCTNEDVLKSLDVQGFDVCFVTIGTDFEASVVITILLKKLGAKKIIAKATQDIQAEILKQVGADEVIYPERDLAQSLAVKYSASNVFDYLELSDEYGIFEIPVLSYWVGESIIKIDVRKKYKLNIIAIRNKDGTHVSPNADYIFKDSDHILVAGKSSDVLKITDRIKD